MKRPVLFRCLFAAVFASALAAAYTVRAQTIADWTFETSQPGVVTLPAAPGANTAFTPFSPEIGAGTATGLHAGASTYSSPAGNGSAHSFSSTLWAVGDYYLFEVNTLGYFNVGLSFDQTSSNTGPGIYTLQYSLNSGATWTPIMNNYTVLANAAPNTPWSVATYNPAYTFIPNLAGAVDNQASVWFELIDTSTTSANGGAVGTGGTDRVDNFDVFVVPEPTSLSLLGGFGVLAWFIRRRK
jgi:hypothetical protein